MKERFLEPFTSLEGRLLPLPSNLFFEKAHLLNTILADQRRLSILVSYWIFAVLGAGAWWFFMNNPGHVLLGDLTQLERLNADFQVKRFKSCSDSVLMHFS
jgi:hypothetical protein